MLRWIKELWIMIKEQCPECGYYCNGKTRWCTKFYEYQEKEPPHE